MLHAICIVVTFPKHVSVGENSTRKSQHQVSGLFSKSTGAVEALNADPELPVLSLAIAQHSTESWLGLSLSRATARAWS